MSEYGRPEGPGHDASGQPSYGQQPEQQPYGSQPGDLPAYGGGQYGPEQYGQQPAYGGPEYGYGYGYGHGYPQAMPQTEGMAIGALVCAIASFVLSCFGIITAIVGLVLARKAKEAIATSAGMKTGDGLVKAALIVSWVYIGLFAAGIVIVAVVITLGATGVLE